MTTSHLRSDQIKSCVRCKQGLRSGEDFCRRCGALNTEDAHSFAGFGIRAVARIIDLIILVIAYYSVTYFIPRTELLEAYPGHFLLVWYPLLLSGAFLFIYDVLFTGLRGQTPGKMAMKIRVVNDQGQAPGIPRAMLREIIGKTLSNLLYLGYIWVAFDSGKRGWHDHIARTRVISTVS